MTLGGCVVITILSQSTATILLRALRRNFLDFVFTSADRCPQLTTPGGIDMRQVRGMLQLSNGTQLEYVAVSLAEKRHGVRDSTGWGGVLKSTGKLPVDMLRDNHLVLKNGSSGVINIVHVSPTAEGSLALFHGVGASDESEDGEGFPPLEAA
jgi:hypothetical protein